MKVREFDPASAERAWQAFRSDIGVSAIQTPKQYERTVALMNRLLDLVGDNERHPLAGLLDLVVGRGRALELARPQGLPHRRCRVAGRSSRHG